MNKKAENSNFGIRLRNIRNSKGFTQEQLAEITGISRRMICHYETMVKRPSLDKVTKIANALNVRIEELLEQDNISHTKSKKNIEFISFKVMRKARLIERLPPKDQKVIFGLIDSLAEKNILK